MANYFWTGKTSGAWATATNWDSPTQGTTASVIPTAADDVTLEGTKNCELGASARKCRSLRAVGYTGKMIQGAGALSIGDATAGAGNVALDLTGVAYEATTTTIISFVSTSATQQAIRLAGQSLRSIKIEGAGASYSLEDELKQAANTDVFSVLKGVFVSNGHTIDIGAFAASGAATRTLNIEGSVVKIKVETGTLWDFTTITGLTFAAAGSTIELVRPGAPAPGEATPLFVGNGRTFGSLKVLAGAVSEQPGIEITGGPTFAGILTNATSAKPKSLEGSISGTTLTVTSGAPNLRKGSGLAGAGVTAGTQVVKEITASTFEVSVSQTVAATTMEVFPPGLLIAASTTVTVEGFEGNGVSGARSRLGSGTAGTQATLKKSNAEAVSVDWMRIRDSKVDASPKWYGGANSVYANQTNWLEEAPPATGAAVAMLL